MDGGLSCRFNNKLSIFNGSDISPILDSTTIVPIGRGISEHAMGTQHPFVRRTDRARATRLVQRNTSQLLLVGLFRGAGGLTAVAHLVH